MSFPDFDNEIARAAWFTRDELDANRKSHLTDGQLESLRAKLQNRVKFAIPFYLIAVAGFALMIYRMSEAKYELPIAILLILAFIVIATPLYFVWLFRSQRPDAISTIEGIATESIVRNKGDVPSILSDDGLVWDITRGGTSLYNQPFHYLQIRNPNTGKKMRYRLPNLSSLLNQHDYWRVYYHPQTTSFLSMEPIEAQSKSS